MAIPSRFVRPAIDTEEGGLWALMDREETRLRRSPLLVRDPALQGYMQDLLCRLAGEHCADVRVHVVRTPQFNATMAPNGMMQVWSGLLLRVENEAQLAAVLGHELAHYMERHALEGLRDQKGRAAFAQLVGVFGLVGALAQVGMLAGSFAFSREHEIRADRLGMHLLQRAGYKGQEAARVWDNLLGELQVTGGQDVGKRSLMMATHPPVETRRDLLLAMAGGRDGMTGEESLNRLMAPHRLGWLHDELRRGQYEESLVLFNRMLERKPGDVQARYARGETYRLRGSEGDIARALDDLVPAVALPDAPVEAHRSLGLIHRQRADASAARAAFQSYLDVAPGAGDAALIQSYLSEMK